MAVQRAWRSVLDALRTATRKIASDQEGTVPQIEYPGYELAQKPLDTWISPSLLQEVKYRGVAVIKGVVAEQQAMRWKDECLEYARLNPAMKGVSA